MSRSLCCGLVLLLWSSAPAMGAGAVEVVYDRGQDRIGIQAKDVTLSQLFAQLAQKAGIESQIDAAVAADRLSVDQPPRPATKALQQLLRGYNYTLTYRSGAKNSNQIVAVTILGAAGKPGTNTSLPPVQHLAREWREAAGAGAVGVVSLSNGMDAGVDAAGATQAPPTSQRAPSPAANPSALPEGAAVPQATTAILSADDASGAASGAPAPVPAPAIPAWRAGPGGTVIEP